jgi:hypothetical protein
METTVSFDGVREKLAQRSEVVARASYVFSGTLHQCTLNTCNDFRFSVFFLSDFSPGHFSFVTDLCIGDPLGFLLLSNFTRNSRLTLTLAKLSLCFS